MTCPEYSGMTPSVLYIRDFGSLYVSSRITNSGVMQERSFIASQHRILIFQLTRLKSGPYLDCRCLTNKSLCTVARQKMGCFFKVRVGPSKIVDFLKES